MQLNDTLARQIVSRAMKILSFSVNVMDERGLIIASGNPERLHQRHEGAVLALTENRVVEISEATAQQLKGVRPGINLPIAYQGELLGVIGISGDPDEVRAYAELVRMTAEMLVGQRNQQAEQQWRRQRCDDLLALLLADSGDSPRLVDEAQQLGLKPQMARTPYLFELGAGQSAEALSAWLASRYPDSWCVSPARQSLLWCRPASVSALFALPRVLPSCSSHPAASMRLWLLPFLPQPERPPGTTSRTRNGSTSGDSTTSTSATG